MNFWGFFFFFFLGWIASWNMWVGWSSCGIELGGTEWRCRSLCTNSMRRWRRGRAPWITGRRVIIPEYYLFLILLFLLIRWGVLLRISYHPGPSTGFCWPIGLLLSAVFLFLFSFQDKAVKYVDGSMLKRWETKMCFDVACEICRWICRRM